MLLLSRSFNKLDKSMKKIVALLFISTLVWANPTSIHWSVQGRYLVDQNGNRTHIEGHPLMECYQGIGTVKGYFIYEIDGSIYLSLYDSGKTVFINRPVCDLR